jgi:hypothetical protein
MLWDGSIIKDNNFLKLTKPSDGDNFKEVSSSSLPPPSFTSSSGCGRAGQEGKGMKARES